MRTQSKKTPRIKGKPPDVNEVCPIISLEETKKLIGDNLLRDERKIKCRNPKRHVVSEEKWGEGTTWNDILQEGREREKEMTLEERKAKGEQSYDKAMVLQIPGTKPLKPIIKPKPPPKGYIRELVEPSEVGNYLKYS